MSKKKIHIECAPITGTIYAGTLLKLKAGLVWAPGKQDVTVEALVAVAEHALKFGAPVVLSTPDGDPKYRITVERVGQEEKKRKPMSMDLKVEKAKEVFLRKHNDGKEWIPPTLIGREVGGEGKGSSFGSSICTEMVCRGLCERNTQGHYRFIATLKADG